MMRPMRCVATIALGLTLVLAGLAGCSGTRGGKGKAGSAATDPRRFLDGVPAGAGAVAWIDSPRSALEWAGWWPLGKDDGKEGGDEEAKALRAELATYLRDRIGLDVEELRSAVFFLLVEGEGMAAAILRSVSGELKVQPTDGTFEVARQGDAIVIGRGPAVRAAIDVLAGRAPSLAKADPKVAAMFEGQARGSFVGAWASAALVEKLTGQTITARFGPEHGLLLVSRDKVGVVLIGDPNKLDALATLVKLGLRTAVSELEKARDRAKAGEGDVGEGVAAIISAHQARRMEALLAPKIKGDRLTIELAMDLGGNAVVSVAMIGVLAAVAIPAFLQYTRKSRTQEAVEGVERLYSAVAAEYAAKGKLPESVGPTPALGRCCASGSKCPADPTLWQASPWQALGFAVTTEHHYSYSVISEGGTVTVRAQGDLDCDGTYSTFAIGARVVGKTLERAGELARTDELE